MNRKNPAICGAILFLAIFAAYANHFQNTFQFDDWHTVTENPYIRDLRNIPKFFVDGRTFSTLPANQTYRPIVSTTLAIDYRLAGGTNPAWFHIDTFIWYTVLLAAMYFMYLHVMEAVQPDWRNRYVALFASGLFGLHPVCAETVNYIVQRGEIQSTLGVVGGIVLYMYWPSGRKWGAYLFPVIVGALAKPPALMFMPILFAYIYLFESQPANSQTGTRGRLSYTLRSSLPALATCLALAIWHILMTPKSYTTGSDSALNYWLTQPTVILHYIKSFFVPTDLTADTDRAAVTSIFSETSVIGLVLLGGIALSLRPAFRRPELRPVAFGVLWFVLAVFPTSVQPLAELDNDHRMFFPYAGLTLAVCWGAFQYVRKFLDRRPDWEKPSSVWHPLWNGVIVLVAVLILAACGYGVHRRNMVWHTEESLWKDVSEKSPHNGRGLMNYGLVLMAQGDYAGSLDLYHQAEIYTPNYSTLKSNEGIAYGALGDDANAESYFQQAISLAPDNAQGYYFLARWLNEKGRVPEAIELLNQAMDLNSAYMDVRYLLMQIYSDQGDATNLNALAEDTLRLFPGDSTATGFLAPGSLTGPDKTP